MYDTWHDEGYDYLMHYGVKGMKWGHRKRYYDSSGNLNARGIKKYAKAGYAQDSYNSNKTKLGKAYDRVTGAHKIGGDMMYNMSSQKANKARAEKYAADEKARKEAANTPEAKAARRKKALKVGAAVAGTALAAYGAYKVTEAIKNKNFKIQDERGRKAFDEFMKNNTVSTHGIDTFKDGTSRVHEFFEDGGHRQSTFANASAAQKYASDIGIRNLKAARDADAIYESYLSKGSNASLKEATRNVYDYYKDKKRR